MWCFKKKKGKSFFIFKKFEGKVSFSVYCPGDEPLQSQVQGCSSDSTIRSKETKYKHNLEETLLSLLIVPPFSEESDNIINMLLLSYH